MRMRFGLVWGAVALTLLTVTAALRTTQVDGVSRTSRRLTSSPPSAPDSINEGQVDAPTFRPRTSRRREEPRDAVRARTRSRTPDIVDITTERATNERFDSRRTRTRQPAEAEVKTYVSKHHREDVIRNRARPPTRRASTQPTPILEVSSPTNEAQIEANNTNIDDITKTRQDTNHYRRRSTTQAPDVTPRRRGRISSRTNARSLDLEDSGSTNNILVVEKAPTTARTESDLRNPRKLRYKTRTSETDTNLTGEGLKTLKEVKSSQNENTTSQPEIETSAPIVVERIVQESTEANKLKTTTLKVMKVVRRPLTRGISSKISSPSKVPSTEEISEDDNYPESFKALIQAKNASTQVTSSPKEAISLRASQKVYKTYSSSSQSTQSGSTVNKYSRLRKQKIEASNNDTEETKLEEAVTPEPPAKITDFRSRGKFSARSKISSSTSTETVSTSEKPVSKYSRKFKFTTSTQAPKSNDDKVIEASSKKPFVRPLFHPRKVADKNNETVSKPRVTLPRTSFYSRQKNQIKNVTSTTEANKEEITAQSKAENIADMPIIYTLLKNNDEKPIVSESLVKKDTNIPKEPFLIAVSSTESQEIMMNNEVTEVTERRPVVTVQSSVSMKQDDRKYHANYKDQNPNTEDNEHSSSTAVPPVRNIQSRKYGRQRKQKAKIDDSPETSTAKVRDRNIRKFSETYSKTTEATNNGIIADSEKSKSRFSSKYRASLLNKTFYKPTVPSVTTSTAWLKFFVTDHQTKSLEEANWFDQDLDMTTESVMTTAFTHEPSRELVEGEEIQLGPDLNAIVITPTRRTLSSADLRLSESLVKPSQVMNVEASHHSPSVTVSIFDALAEILTSTPKPRISSTTEVTTKQTPNTDVTQTLGVSNIVYVNSIATPSPDAFVSTDASSSTITVQTTVQTTPNVINTMSTGETVTPSTTKVVTPVNTPTTPLPPPSTPVSARKPFAIKVLYSDTEPSTDKTSTAPDLSSQPTTDNPATVYNTVSDLLLSNSNLVSSELTSMLSNNIIDIIQNMDEDSRSKVSVDMAKILKNLIPRALDGLGTVLDNADNPPNTTPYSLEDIKDTANIDIDTEPPNIFQAETFDVNSITRESVTDAPVVNNVDVTNALPTMSESQTTSSPVKTNDESINNDITTEGITSSDFDTELIDVNSENVSTNNNTVALPFLTNFQVKDFTSSDENNDDEKPELLQVSAASKSATNDFDLDLQDPSQVSPLQLWVLSKKARVLKMIEDLLRQHNVEIATASTLIDIVKPSSNNINLSRRLTDIMNNMTSTTESSASTMTDFTENIATSSPTPVPSSTTVQSSQIEATTSGSFDVGSTLASDIQKALNEVFGTTTDTSSDISVRFGTEQVTTESSITTTVPTQQTSESEFAKLRDASTTTTSGEETTTQGVETTTVTANTETTTSSNIDTTTSSELFNDNTTTDNTATEQSPTTSSTSKLEPVDTTTPVAPISVATPLPKRDYVIFGILPNNTVVRKNPNNDVLESLTEASPYIVYGLLPNNTIIRKFPNGTRVPRVMQKIDVLPISPWSLKNPYSPIHNNPAIVRPQANPIRVSTNTVTATDITNNGTERLTTDTVNNQQMMISSSALNFKSSSLGITPVTNMSPAEKSTASHVLSLRTTTMLPSIDEILLNSISSAAKQEMVISSMTSSTHEPRILTLDIDPETQQIRTEKPSEDGSAVFKFIPIDEIMVQTQNSNVLKLATKAPTVSSTETAEVQVVTSDMGEGQTQAQTSTTESQVNLSTETNTFTATIESTTSQSNVGTLTTVSNTEPTTTIAPITTTQVTTTLAPTTTIITTTQAKTTQATTTTQPLTNTEAPTTTQATTTQATTTQVPTTTQILTTRAPITNQPPITNQAPTLTEVTTTTQVPMMTTETTSTTTDFQTTILTTSFNNEVKTNSIQNTPSLSARDSKNLNFENNINSLKGSESTTTTRVVPTSTIPQNDPTALLQALLAATGQNQLSLSNIKPTTKATTTTPASTTRSIEDDIKQFEENTKLLKALLAATGQNPASLNLPSLDKLITTQVPTTTFIPTTTPTTTMPTITRQTATVKPSTTTDSTTKSLEDDIKQYNEDVKLLQALLQATGQNPGTLNIPQISGITSNVRISSNPKTTSLGSSPTTPMNVRPVFTTRQPEYKTFIPGPTITTFGPSLSTTTENVGISTTFSPFDQRRQPTTTGRIETVTLTGRRAPTTRFSTTEMPSTSTFSVEEDLMFLQNLKTVLNTNGNNEDPEAALANRIISLAVERSLNEIKSGTKDNSVRTGKNIANNAQNSIPTTPSTTTTTPRPTTTTEPTTTTQTTTTNRPTTTLLPSIEEDIKQFQEDTKLLQALIKATGQDPSKFNIPTLPNLNIATTTVSSKSTDNKLLFKLLASPTPNDIFDHMTPKPSTMTPVIMTDMTKTLPFGARIVVKDDFKTLQDDGKLIKTLIKLQDAQETTTQRSKLAVTGQTSDEALKNLIQKQNQATGMVSEATRAPMSLSTEYGKSNDALLAALLKEQGFGPTTASSLDEQLRLAALLNQVVVTPKARRTTTPPPPPPPPAPRRPILDGLAWLWQQWRETAPGSGGQRQNPRPVSASRPSEATSTRVNWFGSGPFVGNADDRPANRIPLEPPRAVTSQAPGRGQLVSAAINVTRAFSQFLGAAIQGAAQTVQSVFRAGQRVASDVYTNGSGGAG